jgi:hypothetical protein
MELCCLFYVGAGVLTCPAERSSANNSDPSRPNPWQASLARPHEDIRAYVVPGACREASRRFALSRPMRWLRSEGFRKILLLPDCVIADIPSCLC